MPAEKIDVRKLALKADRLAHTDVEAGLPSGMWFLRRDEHFARLVMKACVDIIEEIDDGDQPAYRHCQEEIRARMP